MERATGTAQTAARMVSFGVENRTLEAYLALPASGDHPSPGVVVIHEAYGLNDNIKGVAERFAAEGYAALAIDLFAGRNLAVCMARLFGGLLFNSLGHGGVRDLRDALSFLGRLPETDGERLGAIEFCLGGGLALALACADERLNAVAPFYGPNPRPLEAVRRSCPVVGAYGEKDPVASQGRKLREALERGGVPGDVKFYPGARHSFFDERGKNHDPAAAEDSWRRTLAFFDEWVASGAAKDPGSRRGLPPHTNHESRGNSHEI